MCKKVSIENKDSFWRKVCKKFTCVILECCLEGCYYDQEALDPFLVTNLARDGQYNYAYQFSKKRGKNPTNFPGSCRQTDGWPSEGGWEHFCCPDEENAKVSRRTRPTKYSQGCRNHSHICKGTTALLLFWVHCNITQRFMCKENVLQ